MSFSVQKITIGELLSGNRLYVLPIFQRPFSWTTEEAERLLDDISCSCADDDEREYFLGMLVCVRQMLTAHAPDNSMSEPGIEVNDVIDGQQRLGTLTILLSVLRDLSQNDAEREEIQSMVEFQDSTGVYPFRLTLFTNDTEIFEQYVQPSGATLNDCEISDLLSSQRNILEIRDMFVERLTVMAPEHRSGILRYIRNKVALIETEAPDVDEGFKIFISINQTGKMLASADIGRAIFLGSVPAEKREDLTRQWRENEKKLGDEFSTIFSHVQRIHGRRNERIIAENVAISKFAGGSAAYITNILNPLCDALHFVINPDARNLPADHPVHRHLAYLNWFSHRQWVAPAIHFISKNRNKNDDITEFLAQLHRLTIGLSILGIGKDKRITRYRGVITNIGENDIWNPTTGKLQLTRAEQGQILRHMTFSLYKRSGQIAKLMLLILNDHFAGGDVTHTPLDVTVEHVLPRSPKKNSEWRQIFSNANERDAAHASIGNLILLDKEMNNKIENKEYGEKIDLIFKKDEVTDIRTTTEFAISNRLLNFDKWDFTSVMENEQLYLDMLKKILRLEGACGDELRNPSGGAGAKKDA